ncbi:MAG: 7TM-DISM domain-containing protein [Methylococcales bacterium]
MKQLFIRLILLMLISNYSVAWSNDNLDVNDSLQSSVSLTSYLDILEDASQQLTLADIENAPFKTGYPAQESINLSFTSSAYWLRLVIDNSSDQPINKVIELDYPMLKYVDFYWQIDNKNIQTIHTGFALPFENRAYKSKIFAFPVQFPAHTQSIIYLRVASLNAITVMAKLWEPMAFQHKERNDYLTQSLYFGIVLAITLFSLGLALFLKELDYFLYLSMIFFTACTFIANRGLGAELIWPNFPFLTQIGSLGFGSFALVGHLLFMSRLLNIKQHMPKISWVVNRLMALILVMPFLLSINFKMAQFANFLFIGTAAVIFLISLISTRQKQRNAYFLCISFSALSLGIIIGLSHHAGLISANYSFYSLNIMQMGSAFELLVLTLFLTDRYRLIQQEKLTADNLLKQTHTKLLSKTEEHKASVNQQLALTNQVYQMQKLESVTRLTSGIAHDFNNILGSIVGYNALNTLAVQDYQDKNLQNAEELLFNNQQIDTASQHAMKLIQKMMSYSSKHPVDKEIELRPTYDVIKEILIMLRPGLRKSCQVNTDLDHDCNIQIDATHLGQILTNLLVNARDAMPDQTGVITISLKKIILHEASCTNCALAIKGDFIELSVSDNGSGLKASVIKHIFDPFFTTKEIDKGTGLGLYTVNGMVHDLGGHIMVESSTSPANKGSTFRLLFPVKA